MFDHIGLDVTDLRTSAAFYKAVLATLGIPISSEDDSSLVFANADVSLSLTAGRSKTSRAHLAFTARDTDAVDAFHTAGVDNGGTDNGAPGIRDDYAPGYYAAFVLDPDGNNVEAVHTSRK